MLHELKGWMTAADAADRLGVKPATLYAYVSRGVLARRRSPTGQSLFDPAEIERLTARGRPRRQPGAAEVVIESRITALGADRPFYRGRDALELAGTHRFEAVAEFLWTGVAADLEASVDASEADVSGLAAEPAGAAPADRPAARSMAPVDGLAAEWTAPADGWAAPARGQADGLGDRAGAARMAPADGWAAPADGLAAGTAAQSGLPAGVLPLERLQVVVPALAAADPLRSNLDPAAVVEVARGLIAGMVDSLPGPSVPGGIATRLWAKLAPPDADPALIGALEAALVLIADHELAASTTAARMAASVRADPYAVVMTGLGATSGVLHGGASLGAESLLAEAHDPAHAREVVALRLRRGERIPGFGHMVYKSADGRATTLLDRVRAAVGDDRMAVPDAVIAEARRRRVPAVNIDFALATLTYTAGMAVGTGEALFGIARTAGWIAHAMEEYAHRTPLRLRAVYIGQT
jgi:citrate synthase